MRLSLTVFPLLGWLGAHALADGSFTPSGRAGLFTLPGHTPGKDSLQHVTESGLIWGYSEVAGGRAVWVTDSSSGVSRRVGLYTGEGFENEPDSWIKRMAENGLAYGYSRRRGADGSLYYAPWVADGATGVTHRMGLQGAEFVTQSSLSGPYIGGVSADGHVWGISSRIPQGQAAWVADPRTGAVIRVGLYSGDSSLTSGVSGTQYSGITASTESGWLAGQSHVYNTSPEKLGFAVWIARADTGLTRRTGLFQGGEFSTGPGGQLSEVLSLTESGWVAGVSDRFRNGGAYIGVAAWVEEAATGVIRRLGLEGPEFTHTASGTRYSRPWWVTESGWITGVSDISSKGTNATGRGAWVADAATGITRRVGLFEEEEFKHPSIGGGSLPRLISEGGWVAGISYRYLRSQSGSVTSQGEAAWVADGATGVTRRIGLTGPGFTGSSGGQSSTPGMVGLGGLVTGTSRDYRLRGAAAGTTGSSPAAWVADGSTGKTRPIGLLGEDYMTPGGHYEQSPVGMAEIGRTVVLGYSTLYRGGAGSVGRALWMEDAAADAGGARRLGLTEGVFTGADGSQDSTLESWTRSGYAYGFSTIPADGPYPLIVPWVADLRTGQTSMAGLPGRRGRIRVLTESGLAGGYSEGPGDSGSTAWVFDAKTGRRVTFDLSVRTSTGYAHSWMEGLTEEGVLYGTYALYDGDADLGRRFFLWMEGLDTLLVEGVAPVAEDTPGGPTVMRVTPGGMAVFSGAGAGVPGRSVFYGKLTPAVSPVSGARVTDLLRLPDGKYRLTFHTDAAVRITLQSSADLSAWRDAQTIDAPAGASHMEIEPDPDAPPNQYWRLKTAPAAP